MKKKYVGWAIIAVLAIVAWKWWKGRASTTVSVPSTANGVSASSPSLLTQGQDLVALSQVPGFSIFNQ